MADKEALVLVRLCVAEGFTDLADSVVGVPQITRHLHARGLRTRRGQRRALISPFEDPRVLSCGIFRQGRPLHLDACSDLGPIASPRFWHVQPRARLGQRYIRDPVPKRQLAHRRRPNLLVEILSRHVDRGHAQGGSHRGCKLTSATVDDMPKTRATARSRVSVKKKAPTGPSLYLGSFFFDEPGEQDHTGTFQILVKATSPADSVERFKARLRKLRDTTTLFNKPTTIYINGIIKLAGSFTDGLLVSYSCGESPEPPSFEIGALIPEQKDHACIEYGYTPPDEGRTKSEDADTIRPFLDLVG